MNRPTTSFSFRHFILSFFFTLIAVAGFAQTEPTDTAKTEVPAVSLISIEEVSEETERVSQRIVDLKDVLEPKRKVQEIDSALYVIEGQIGGEKDSLIAELESISRKKLRIREVEWLKYKSLIKNYQEVVDDRTEEIKGVNDELVKEIQKWEATKESISTGSDTLAVQESFDNVILNLKDALNITLVRVDSVFAVQKRLTDIVIICDEALKAIERSENELRMNYFVLDGPPIWRAGADSLNKEEKRASGIALFKEGVKDDQAALIEFFELNIETVVFQWLFVFLIFLLMLFVRRRWKTDHSSIPSSLEIDTRTILKHPVAATVVVGVLASAFFYEALFPFLAFCHVILIFLGTIVLLPQLTVVSFRRVLLIFLAAYLIQFFDTYLDPLSKLSRWLVMLQSAMMFGALLLAKKVVLESPGQFKRIVKPTKFTVPIFVFLLAVALVVNVFGMVSLARFLYFGVLSSAILGTIVYLMVKVVTSIVILIFKLRSYNLATVSSMVHATHKRIQPILFFFGFILWIVFTARGFDVYDFFMNQIDHYLHLEWSVGEMVISLGGILSFLFIFIIAILIAQLVASIFQDEWMVTVLPRGIAPAVSLLLRIILITIGLYMGLSAAGLDLSKLGFVIGTLGVGIGFGLQNVVLNFVAGMILAFERPINLGDTIEIDNEYGVVSNIGVRSSNIRSYSGAEAIIPNGDLISKKVINWTLSSRDRRSDILLKTSPDADPEKVIALFNKIAADHPKTLTKPEPVTYFKGYTEDGNLSFQLWYWTTFSETLDANHDIAMSIFKALKEAGIQAPAPVRRIVKG